MRSRKVYNILSHAIVDAPFRESLFQKNKGVMDEWELTKEERSYLERLPYKAFEQMVGGIVSHWLVPMVVNNRYLILPESASNISPNGYIPIRLTESLVFGNGAHATTSLCLAALDKIMQPGATVLDLGTGSGILSIAAALQEASSVLAFDIDAGSVNIAKKNISLNPVDGIITVRPGSLEQALKASAESGRFDLVLVNILTPVILSFLETGLAEVLKPGGFLVTSGIEPHEVPLVKRAASIAGLIKIVGSEMHGWAAVTAQKPSRSH